MESLAGLVVAGIVALVVVAWRRARPRVQPMTARQEAFIAVLVAERDVSGLEEVLEEAVPEFQRSSGATRCLSRKRAA